MTPRLLASAGHVPEPPAGLSRLPPMQQCESLGSLVLRGAPNPDCGWLWGSLGRGPHRTGLSGLGQRTELLPVSRDRR